MHSITMHSIARQKCYRSASGCNAANIETLLARCYVSPTHVNNITTTHSCFIPAAGEYDTINFTGTRKLSSLIRHSELNRKLTKVRNKK